MRKLFLLMLTGVGLHKTYGQVSDSIQTPQGYLHYHLYGKGKPVVLLSGGPGASAFMLEPIAKNLSNEFQMILFEQRGTGNSTAVPLDSTTINLQQAMEDINTLRNHLGIQKLSLIGHSYGALLAAYYAITYPQYIDKLVPVGLGIDSSFVGYNRTAWATAQERKATKRGNDSVRLAIATPETVARNRKRNLRLAIYDAYKTDSLYAVLAKGGPLSVKMNQLMQSGVSRKGLSKAQMATVKDPTLVICGRQDPGCIFSTFYISQANKRMLINWINKSGPYPFVEQPDEFYKAVLPFLKPQSF